MTFTQTACTDGCAHKNAGEVLAFYRQIRMRYPAKQKLYLIADNLSTHKTPAVREWAATANTELIFTPTYASFLNRIECHFLGINESVINNADYPDWTPWPRRWPTTSATATARTATNA